MNLINISLLRSALAPTGPTIKFVLNDEAIAFFPVSEQHRDVKLGGLSYEDDYRGNAAAGLIVSGRAEIRHHAAFSDERIRTIWRELRACPECKTLPLENLSYQGRDLFLYL